MGQPGLSGEPGVWGPMGPKGEKVSQAGSNFLHEQKEIRPSANEARNCGVKLWVLQDAGITGWSEASQLFSKAGRRPRSVSYYFAFPG